MSTSLITVVIIDDHKGRRKTRWSTDQNHQTLIEVVKYGLTRLECSSKFKFNYYEMDKNGAKERINGDDDLLLLGNDYLIIDERADNENCKRFLCPFFKIIIFFSTK